MPGPAIRVEGLREVNAELRKLQDRETPKAIREATKKSVKIVADRAAELAPNRTGRLAKSIRAVATPKRGAVVAGSSTKVPYAAAVHWGTGPRAGLKGPHNIKPSLFMMDAVAEVREDVIDAYREAMREIGL